MTVRLSAAGDEVLVDGAASVAGRRARLFFRSILGGQLEGDRWIIPTRRRTSEEVLLQVYRWLEDAGHATELDSESSAMVEREVERHRSLRRAREAGDSAKRGEAAIDLAAAQEVLAATGWEPLRVLRPHQEAGLRHGLAAANPANFSVPGSGKTTTALAVLGVHLGARTIEFAVVVGPLSSFRPWESEARLAFADRLRVRRVRGTAAQRSALYRDLRPRDVLLLSYATAAADEQRLREVFNARPGMLIVDESHRIKRFEGGTWAPALVAVARSAQVRMILSGTPMPNSALDLYSQLNVLWPDELLTGTRGAFAQRVDTDFFGLLRDVEPFMSRTPKSELGLEPYTVEFHPVEMGPLQAELYELLEDRFRREVEDAPTWQDKIEALRKARPIRLLQAATNPAVLNQRDPDLDLPAVSGEPQTVMERLQAYTDLERPAKHRAALDLVRELIPDGGKAVVWGTFLHNLDSFARHARDELRIPVFQVDGRVPLGDSPADDTPDARTNPRDVDSREERISSFLAAQGTALLVANPASCSESISLHSSCRNAIYLDRTYDCALFLQSVDRVHRLGLPEGAVVRVHVLQSTLAGGLTIDHVVDSALTTKEAQMRLLLEGAELLPANLPDRQLDAAEGGIEDLERTLRYLLGKSEI